MQDVNKINQRLNKLATANVKLRENLNTVNSTIAEFANFEAVIAAIRRVEFERWITFSSLFVIMIIVIFFAVVGFCRHSKKAAVM